MIDWLNELRPGQAGLATEGVDDQKIIEAFLNGGMVSDLWSDWTAKLRVLPANSAEGVLRELRRTDLPTPLILWGLIDRDWRTDDQLRDLQNELPQLRILPRMMIDNYLTSPEALASFVPASRMASVGFARLQNEIASSLNDWVLHGALAKILYEHDAHRFCRGPEGYPRALLDAPVTSEAEIERLLKGWIAQLEPAKLLLAYRQQANLFTRRPIEEQYHLCIDGKAFFNQVVIPILNHLFGQKDRGNWLGELLQNPQSCPADLAQLLKPLLV